jgi:hypothetical protein
MDAIFENEEIYSIPEPGTLSLYFNNSGFEGPLICIKKSELSETNISFLEKIIKAIGFDLKTQCELAIFENDQQYVFRQVLGHPESGQTLLFGQFHSQFDFQFHVKLNEWINMSGYSFLFSYDLASLANDQGKKQELWKALKSKYV